MGPIDVLSARDNTTNAATWNGKYSRSAYKIGLNVTLRGEICGVVWPRTSATSDTTVRSRVASLSVVVVVASIGVFGTDVQLARAETDTGPLNAPPVRSIITGSSAAPGSPRSHGNGGSGMGRSCRASAPCVRPRSGTAAATIARHGRKISPTQMASSSLATTTMRTGCRWTTSSRTTGSRPSRRTRTRSSRSFDVE